MGICSTRYSGPARLDGKTAIITGCNTGIGKFTAFDFYKRGCRVIMACRDQAKASAAREEILQKCSDLKGTGELVLRPLDLSSLESVKDFAAQTMEKEKKIHLLINNAGVMMCPKSKTADGFELQFGTNHLGHYLLTLLLLPRIISSAPARIVNVSSLAHTCKSVNVYVLHPGVVNTELSRHASSIFFPGASWAYQHLCSFFQKDEEQGAATTLYCALDEKTASETGLYYSDCSVKACHRQASDPAKAKKLWDISADMVKLEQINPAIYKGNYEDN